MTDELPESAGDENGTAEEQARPDVSHLKYEDARDELVSIVSRLESGRVGLEDTMALWERGEALAAHCSAWLDGAEARLARRDAANAGSADAGPGQAADDA